MGVPALPSVPSIVFRTQGFGPMGQRAEAPRVLDLPAGKVRLALGACHVLYPQCFRVRLDPGLPAARPLEATSTFPGDGGSRPFPASSEPWVLRSHTFAQRQSRARDRLAPRPSCVSNCVASRFPSLVHIGCGCAPVRWTVPPPASGSPCARLPGATGLWTRRSKPWTSS